MQNAAITVTTKHKKIPLPVTQTSFKIHTIELKCNEMNECHCIIFVSSSPNEEIINMESLHIVTQHIMHETDS